jgi:hypothetical protein
MKKQGWKMLAAGLMCICLTALVTACGGGGGGSSVQTGVFADAPVDGITYKTATQSGETTGGGKFKYIAGETVTFSIGSTTLGATTAKATLTPVDLTGASDTTDSKTQNIVRLISSVVTDPTALTWTVDSTKKGKLASATAINFSSSTFASDVQTAIGSAPIFSSIQAQSHLDTTLKSVAIAGRYTGSFTGTSSGTFDITFNMDGTVSGSATDSSGTHTGSGTYTPSGGFNFSAESKSSYTYLDGTVTTDGKISGNWQDGLNSGTFNGSKDGSSTVTPTGGGNSTTTSPTVTAFTIPATSTSLTVPITNFTGSDSTGITGYYVLESSTTPSSSASGWSSSKPTSYTFTSAGSKTLYAWVKNASGLVSASKNATVTITILTPPSSFADIAGTWKITSPSGNTDTFTVANDGKITKMHLAVNVTTEGFGSGFGFNGSLGNGTETVDVTFGTISTANDFKFSGSGNGSYSTLSVAAQFDSATSISGTYSANYDHKSYTSASVMEWSGGSSGKFTATKQ